MAKLVSVIIPTFNRHDLTDIAVASVVTSCPSLVEILVVDDCSSTAYCHDDMNASGIHVCVVRLCVNVGAGMARQAGVALASGAFIAFLDSDDTYDKGWMDHVLALLQLDPKLKNGRLLISGITQGERRVNAVTRKILTNVPQFLQLTASRFVSIMFNPFYTPSLVMSNELCDFRSGLRHCEDYYSTSFALMRADKIFLPSIIACNLGRAPNSVGGESAARERMFSGEMQVRIALLRMANVPLGYKLLVPLGITYQWCREVLKRIFHFFGEAC